MICFLLVFVTLRFELSNSVRILDLHAHVNSFWKLVSSSSSLFKIFGGWD